MNILVKRGSALGDVLCVTPIVARLRRENPDAFIGVQTGYPNVFQANPHVDAINVERDWDRVIDLDMAHECRRRMQAIEAYSEVAFGDRGAGTDRSIVFVSSSRPILPVDWAKVVCIHANKSWQNRTMPNAWWDEVFFGMVRLGCKVVALGTGIDYCPPGAVDTRDRLTLHQQGAVIAGSRLFICGASGLFVLAAATETQVIVPLTINSPETALPWRWGKHGGGFHPLVADVPCLGCSERAGAVTELGCEVGTYACIATIRAERAIELVRGILQGVKA